MIKVVIVDDEPAMQAVNRRLLTEYFPQVNLVGIANSIESGIALINEQDPDLVLLDIELTDGTGFQLLKQMHPYRFKVVFITAFDNYAIKAIKFSALDYIVKPVNEVEFQQAIQRVLDRIGKEENSSKQFEVLSQSLSKDCFSGKLVLRTLEALHVVDICDIYFCKSDNSYTIFHLGDQEKIMVSRSLKDYEKMLSDHGFFRVHQSYLVNIEHIKRIEKSDGGYLLMKNGNEIPVSTRQMKRLLSLFG